MIDRLSDVARRFVPRETFEKLEQYEAMLREENRRQNLVSKSTLCDFWHRHILDCAQLVRFEPRPRANWLDIGSGAGLPGIVISCLIEGHVTLLEPRHLRADFLHRVCDSLGLNAAVVEARAERALGKYEVITARAVARLTRMLEISAHLSTRKTVWALPKGRHAREELAEAQQAWQGTFHVEHSATDADSYIVVAAGVRARR